MASSRCSHSSSTTRLGVRPSSAATRRTSRLAGASALQPCARASSNASRSAERTRVSDTHVTRRVERCAVSSATDVLPMPPRPSTCTVRCRSSRSCSRATSSSRPSSCDSGAGGSWRGSTARVSSEGACTAVAVPASSRRSVSASWAPGDSPRSVRLRWQVRNVASASCVRRQESSASEYCTATCSSSTSSCRPSRSAAASESASPRLNPAKGSPRHSASAASACSCAVDHEEVSAAVAARPASRRNRTWSTRPGSTCRLQPPPPRATRSSSVPVAARSCWRSVDRCTRSTSPGRPGSSDGHSSSISTSRGTSSPGRRLSRASSRRGRSPPIATGRSPTAISTEPRTWILRSSGTTVPPSCRRRSSHLRSCEINVPGGFAYANPERRSACLPGNGDGGPERGGAPTRSGPPTR